MIKAMNSFWDGLRLVAKYPKHWFMFYAINFLFAIVIAYPARALVGNYFGHSLQADYFLNQFNYMAVVNFLKDNASGLSVLLAVFLVLALFYLLIQYFLAGGIYSIYIQEDPPTDLPGFFQLCTEFFGRFLRILLLGLLFLLTVVFIYFLLNGFLGLLKKHIFNEIYSSLLRGSVLFAIVLLVLFFSMLLDYTKTFLVLDKHKSVLAAFAKSVGFVAQHFGSTILLYFLLVLTGVFLIAVYLVVSRYFNGQSWLYIGILFALQQIFIFFRVGLRLQFFASQIALAKNIRKPFSFF